MPHACPLRNAHDAQQGLKICKCYTLAQTSHLFSAGLQVLRSQVCTTKCASLVRQHQCMQDMKAAFQVFKLQVVAALMLYMHQSSAWS